MVLLVFIKEYLIGKNFVGKNFRFLLKISLLFVDEIFY